MQHKQIKIKYQLKLFSYYFQKQFLINKPDSLSPQWSRQAVIMVSRSTWNSKKIKWKGSRHQSFLFRCDWPPMKGFSSYKVLKLIKIYKKTNY